MRDGGSLTIDDVTLGGSYGVTGGTSGGGGATGGQAQGTTMFLQGTGTTAFTSGTQTLAGANARGGSGGLPAWPAARWRYAAPMRTNRRTTVTGGS